MLTCINLSEGKYLDIDLNVQTVMRVLLQGEITSTVTANKIEYTGTGLVITVNTTPLQWTFIIRTTNIMFEVSYVDFPEMPQVLADIIDEYRMQP